MRNQTWKWVLIALVIGWAMFQAYPRAERPVMNMKLGLDLKGGSHLLMQVQTDDAIKAEAGVVATRLQQTLTEAGFATAEARSGEVLDEVVVRGVPADQLASLQTAVEEEVPEWSVSRRGDEIIARIPGSQQEYLRDRAVRQALNTISNRIDEFGVAEPIIQRVGGGTGDRILVQLPGVEDPSRVKRILQTSASLELRLLYYPQGGGGPFIGPTEESVVALLGGTVPPNVEILPHYEKLEGDEDETLVDWMAVERTAVVTGSDLSDARAVMGDWGEQVVSFTLRVAAAERFGVFTESNINRQMATILDGKIKLAPSINSRISMRGQIEGIEQNRVEDMALVLRSGALPAGIDILEERTVGPSLGRDSIIAGVWATAIGFALVMVFMVIYYKLSGINAVIALTLNLLLVAAAMASLGATLTLPGIGGFILTVGMAVDANVLIFERIREEIRAGKTVRGALDAGFSKALSAIFDANLTTLIAALFLFNYGTGPVRGFAATLSIGIIASLFTAIFVSRTIFDFVLGSRSVQKLSI